MRTSRRVDHAVNLAAAGAPRLRMEPNLRSFTRVRLTVPASLPMPVSRSVYGADIDEQGSTLFAVGGDGATHLVFGSGAVVPLPEPILSPAVRLLAPDVALVVRRRVFLEGEKNAWIIRRHHEIERTFAIGDGIADVVRTENFLVATYSDEGVFGDTAPAWLGLGVFDRSGRLLWGWNDTIAPYSASPIGDCYAALWLGGDRIAVFSYACSDDVRFEFALLDVPGRSVVVHQAPEALHGSAALSVKSDEWLFRAPSRARQSVFGWRPGGEPVEVARLPEPSRDRWPCRGLKGGRFLDVVKSHAEVITLG
jgi:hypothetical protein